MLFIAIPKSASTSMVDTFGLTHRMQYGQAHRGSSRLDTSTLEMPKGVKILWRYHSDCREYTDYHVEQLVRDDEFFKQHLPPTDNNLKLLHNEKKVVMLRGPREVILAYRRNAIMNHRPCPPDFENAQTEHEWLEGAKKTGLLDDLNWFHDTWLAEQNEKTLIVHCSELLKAPKRVINMVERFWGLPITKKVVLEKKRYTEIVVGR